ncbi:MAG: carboxylate-amine ligase [Pseudomonadota bacterium]
MTDRPPLTIGIEEEYLVVDQETRELVTAPDPGFVAACTDALGEQVTGEYLQCQIEVGTRPHRAVGDAVRELRGLRDGVRDVAQRFGYAPIAASTHPFSRWRDQHRTEKERYEGLERDMGRVVGRLLICGMHIHIGIDDEDLCIDLMNQVTYFLPHLLALSCSSPFWEGEDTGLSSYRLTVFDALPRTGLPDTMNSHTEYRRMIDRLVDAGCIEDGTKIWWDIRPSDKFPTVEQRVTDICSRIEDAAAIAALFQSLMAALYRLKCRNQRWRLYPRTLIMENRWQAQRFGTHGRLVDLGRGQMCALPDLVEELIEFVRPDAESLGCLTEVLHARRIAAEGDSATRQRRVFDAACTAGGDRQDALRQVVDHLIAEF